MKISASVYEPMYEYNGKMYIRFLIPENISKKIYTVHLYKQHLLTTTGTPDNPLEGNILKVKVPFRYRRVMCEVKGKPIQSLVKGDEVEIETEFKGYWNVGNHSGFTWILKSSEYI
jgi:hypothetical protein